MHWLVRPQRQASLVLQRQKSESHHIRRSKMATPKASSHIRSLSLPSTSHPLDGSIENLFRRLSASQAGPSSSSSICQNLFRLKDLYEHMNDLIHLPHNRNVLSHEPHREEVEEVLDGSLTLMDVSSVAMDALSLMKESILDLQSAVRRGSDNDGIPAYLVSRKKICKTISKCLADLKKVEKNCTLTQQGNNGIPTRMLKEAETISLSTLKSLLLYVMGKKMMSQRSGWSLVAKLVKSKVASAEICNEVAEVDYALRSGTETEVSLKQLETLEMTIHELMDVLETVSRCLVKTRVSLLNVLNC